MLSRIGRGVLFAILAAVLLLPGLTAGPSLDPSVFVHVAGEVLRGERLYADTWDHKPPGIYIIYAIAQAILPFIDPWLTAWLLSAAATTGVGLALEAATRRLGVSQGLALLAGVLAVVGMAHYLVALGGGLTEPIASLPLAIALFLLVGEVTGFTIMASGAFAGLALLIAIPVAPGAVALAVLTALRHSPRFVPPLLLGALVPVVAAAAWLLTIGALPAALDAVIRYSAAYRAANASSGWELSRPVITWTVLAQLFLIAPALLGTVAAWRANSVGRQVTIMAATWITLSIVLFAFQGRFFAHYAIPLAIPLAMLAALGIERLKAIHARLSRPLRLGLVYAPVALVLATSLAAGVAGGRMEWLPVARDHERTRHVTAAVRQFAAPGAPIWVWGNEPQLYLGTQRQSATAYSYLYPLVTPGYTTPVMIDSAATELLAERPALVIDAGSRAPGVAGFQHLLIPRPLESDGRDLDELDPLRQAVRDNYGDPVTVDGWVIYRADAPDG